MINNDITGLKMDDETYKKYLREIGKAEFEAKKQELLIGTTRNRAINNNFDRLNEIQQKTYRITQHNNEKLAKKINTSRIFKNIGISTTILGSTILIGYGLKELGILLFNTFGGTTLFLSMAGIIGAAGFIVYGIASYVKKSNEKNRLSELLSASKALEKNSPVVQANLDMSAYTEPKDISHIQSKKTQDCSHNAIEPCERPYEGEDMGDNNDKGNVKENANGRFVNSVNNKKNDSPDQKEIQR